MRLVRLVIAPLLVAAIPYVGPAQPASPCLPADADATNLIEYVKSIITSTDPGMPALRQSLGLGLGSVTVSQVSLVTSGTDCTKARAAMDALANTPNSSRRFYLVKAGNKRFFVRGPITPTLEHNPSHVFDNKWAFIQSMLT
ncbi:MAG: hypothetical protein ACREOG_08065 [Gemmatimonadaceae bacterium]